MQANLANAKLAQMNMNRENTEHILPVKNTMQVQRPHTSHTSHRNALGDIGNKVSAITLDNSKKAPVKKEIVQLTARQQKILSKNKGTSSLRALAETNNVEVVVKQVSYMVKGKHNVKICNCKILKFVLGSSLPKKE